MTEDQDNDGMNDGGTPDEESVATFLRANPDFLSRRSDVMEALSGVSRWDGETVVDFQKAMVERLRGEIDHMRACTNDLIVTSRSNLSVQTRTHAAVLAMLGAESIEHLVRIINEDMPLLLDVDVVTLCLEPTTPPLSQETMAQTIAIPTGAVEQIIGNHEVFLTNTIKDDGTLFGAGAGLVRSAALARIRAGRRVPTGLLGLGSRSHATFHPGQGSELILFLARVVERLFDRWLEAPTA
ncbi:MAG: DUF484 family protein [Rhodospirillales bacterium]|nr:DUF484 family protein [Rhodospirillales bacterium]